LVTRALKCDAGGASAAARRSVAMSMAATVGNRR